MPAIDRGGFQDPHADEAQSVHDNGRVRAGSHEVVRTTDRSVETEGRDGDKGEQVERTRGQRRLPERGHWESFRDCSVAVGHVELLTRAGGKISTPFIGRGLLASTENCATYEGCADPNLSRIFSLPCRRKRTDCGV